MSDKDEIKELFQKELGNYQAKVNPNLWNGIQAGLGSTGAAAGVGSSLGLVGKIVIGVSIAAAVTVGTLLVVNNDDKTPHENQTISNLNTEDSVNKESIERKELKEEKIDDSSTQQMKLEEEVSKEEIHSNFNLEVEQKSDVSPKIITKENKEDISTPLVPQENKVSPQKGESRVIKTPPSTIVENTKNTVSDVNATPPLADNFSELAEVEVQVGDQNNQYVSFISSGIPKDAYVVWEFGDGSVDRSLNPEYFYADAGIYNVKFTVKTDSEETTRSLQVEIKVMGEIGDLPNVFTPNGDGNNDEFFVNCKNIKSFQLTIIDNNQNIIYSTNDVDFRWNGFDKSGQPVKEGTYYYIIVAEDESGNTINKYQQLRLHR